MIVFSSKSPSSAMTQEQSHLMRTYAPLDVRFERGEGTKLYDDQGKQYLDALCGIAVCGLGHSHPGVTAALTEQAATLMHTSNLFQIPLQRQLADKLCEISNMERVFISNSGAEANEAAIKLIRLFGHSKDINEPQIIVTDGSFHGRTMATLSATGSRKVRAGFEPMVSGFVRAPYNDVEAMRNIGANNRNVCAIMVEPVQGEGGIRVPDADYLNQLRELCDENDWLLILDEIQTGMGRSGRWFAHQHNGIQPDIMTLAKGLGNGFPVGACLARGRAAELFAPGNHGSTFGGNPLACRVALSVIEAIEKDHLVERSETLGKFLFERLNHHLDGIEGITEIRHLGLLLGVELDRPAADILPLTLERGLIVNVTSGNVIRILPALITSDEEAESIASTIGECLRLMLLKDAAA